MGTVTPAGLCALTPQCVKADTGSCDLSRWHTEKVKAAFCEVLPNLANSFKATSRVPQLRCEE